MPDVIKFRQPIMDTAGGTDFAIRMLIVDVKIPLVKFLLQEVDEAGVFIEEPNGKTTSIRHEGAEAAAFLAQPVYKSIMEALPAALVAGTSLPAPADIVVKEPSPTPEEPTP